LSAQFICHTTIYCLEESSEITTIEKPKAIRNIWTWVLGQGILTLLLGVAVLVWPGKSVLVASALFGVYLLASGITQTVSAFTLNVPEGGGRVLLFISGALSITLGVLAFRHFGEGYAVLLLAIWIGVSFIFQGVAEIVVASGYLPLPGRGWHVFFGIVSMLAGLVMIAWPFDSIAVLTVVAGAWLVGIGICLIVWTVVARKDMASLDRGLERLTGAAR
jgi:uncharacterized membrane protein HdeD (DUF308 family)